MVPHFETATDSIIAVKKIASVNVILVSCRWTWSSRVIVVDGVIARVQQWLSTRLADYSQPHFHHATLSTVTTHRAPSDASHNTCAVILGRWSEMLELCLYRP